MASELDRKASTVVGGMSLRVEKTGRAPEEAGGSRMQFLYEVRAGEHVYRGTDLYAGVGMDESASRMVGVLAGFLSKAGERYRSGMCPPDDAYPEWVYEQAYLNEDELAMASFELEEPEVFTGRFGEQEGPWASVVFLQGEDADAALSVLEERGPEAAIAHLAQWDFGDETEQAAAANGHVYKAPPVGTWDREFRSGAYHLSWNHSLGHVGLTRSIAGAAEAATPSERARQLGPASPTVTAGVTGHSIDARPEPLGR